MQRNSSGLRVLVPLRQERVGGEAKQAGKFKEQYYYLIENYGKEKVFN